MRALLLHRPYRGLAVTLMACALAMRVLLPTGFMLVPGAHGGLPTVALCPGQGPTPAVAHAVPHDMGGMAMGHMMSGPAMPGHDGHQDHHPGDTGDHPCPFAPVGAAVDLVSVADPVPPIALDVFAPTRFGISAQPGLGLAAPPPPKTGPPAIA